MATRFQKKKADRSASRQKRRARSTPARRAGPTDASKSSNKLRSRQRTPRENVIRNLETRQAGTIKSMHKQMRAKGHSPPMTAAAPLNDTAIAVLEGLGCTILSQEIYTKDFSLISDQTDTETIENVNIIDRKMFNKLSPALMNAGKNFKNFNDPIFTLDQPLSRAQSAARQTEKKKLSVPNVEMLTADLINLNVKDNGVRKLKNFK